MTTPAASPRRRIALVIVSFGSPQLVEDNVSATVADSPDLDVIVVDNFSTAMHRRQVSAIAAHRGWTLIAPETNTGFGTGVNLGASAAIERGATHLLLLNPDATIDSVSIAALADAVSRAGARLASPVVKRPDGSLWFTGMAVDLVDGSMHRGDVADPSAGTIPWLTGACMMMTVDDWKTLGGFDARFFLYWEDVDLCARARESGMSLEVVHDASAVHSVGGTQLSRDLAKSDVYYRYNIRNRMLFAAAHLDAEGIRRWRRSDWRAANAILLRGGRRQFLHRPLAPLRAALRGLREGRVIARRRLAELESGARR